MGSCLSSGKGRDTYATLSGEPESLTPILLSSDDQNHLPRLDSFIAPLPVTINEEEPSAVEVATKTAATTSTLSLGNEESTGSSKKVKPLQKPPEPDPFDDFFRVPKNFDHNFSTDPYQFGGIPPQTETSQGPEIEDDNISFPSLPDHLPSPAPGTSTGQPKGYQEPESPAAPSVNLSAAIVSPLLAAAPDISGGHRESSSSPQPKQQQEPKRNNSTASNNKKESKKKKKKKDKAKSSSSSNPKTSSKTRTSSPTVIKTVPPAPPQAPLRIPRQNSASSAMSSSQYSALETPQPSSNSGMRFDELYRLRGVLGTGAFSTVREGYHRSSSTFTYAVKCVNRKKLSEEDEAALLDEVEILKEMKHVHIIRLYDFFIEPSTYYLVMERMSGGELFDRIVAKAYYNEKEARDVCKIVLEAVRYCHANNVAHRDLKPENLLLLSQDDDSQVKIADFGFAKRVHVPMSLTTQCGTPGYVAPEILEGTPYDTRADMWSVGVILYILLGGYPPFIENNQRDLFRKIRRGEYEFHDEYWGTVSVEAKDLISSLLDVEPRTRLSATQALENPWIRVDDDVLAQRDLGVNLKKLTTYNAKRKFKAAVYNIMAVNKLQSLGKDFLKNLN